MRTIPVLILTLTLSAPVHAQSGTLVRAMCLAEDKEAVSMCVGYTTGLAHALVTTRSTADRFFCPPSDFEPQGGGEVLLEFLDAHPEWENEDAAEAMLTALIDKYPCP